MISQKQILVLFRLFIVLFIDNNERCNTVNAPSTGLGGIHFWSRKNE